MTHMATLQLDELGLAGFALELERALRQWLHPADEVVIDPLWTRAREVVTEFALRPAKRVRPTLLAAGYAVARLAEGAQPIAAERCARQTEAKRTAGRGGATQIIDVESIVDFGVGLELLHAFMLVHDDVADRAESRRGGPTLHRALEALHPGSPHEAESLAIVAGDHLYARALEAMLATPAHAAVRATQYMLEVCRHTAAGQHLDLALTRQPLPGVRLAQAVKVARLKTAKYGFVAPLVCGAMLGGASTALVSALERVGRSAGLAYQLRDDVIGLFGDDAVAGKSGGGDFLEGKRTFPVLAAWIRADAAGRARLETLWKQPSTGTLAEARAEVERWGGLAATERLVSKVTAQARRRLAVLPASPVVPLLDAMLESMAVRVS